MQMVSCRSGPKNSSKLLLLSYHYSYHLPENIGLYKTMIVINNNVHLSAILAMKCPQVSEGTASAKPLTNWLP